VASTDPVSVKMLTAAPYTGGWTGNARVSKTLNYESSILSRYAEVL
jgi:hypothetical protein